ncbi:hypothetical protein LZ023_37645 (plasmid) [Pseudomonas silvicola]|nr:hypothetical protein LZ023_37645 [Pseudomonas silvicola]
MAINLGAVGDCAGADPRFSLGYPITPIVLFSLTAELVPPSLRGSAIGFVMIWEWRRAASRRLWRVITQHYTLQPVWLVAAWSLSAAAWCCWGCVACLSEATTVRRM